MSFGGLVFDAADSGVCGREKSFTILGISKVSGSLPSFPNLSVVVTALPLCFGWFCCS